jgi:hypothetical protein
VTSEGNQMNQRTYPWYGVLAAALLAALLGLVLTEAFMSHAAKKIIVVDDIRYAAFHDYCPDVPGTQGLINGGVICDPPILQPAPEAAPAALPNTGY